MNWYQHPHDNSKFVCLEDCHTFGLSKGSTYDVRFRFETFVDSNYEKPRFSLSDGGGTFSLQSYKVTWYDEVASFLNDKGVRTEVWPDLRPNFGGPSPFKHKLRPMWHTSIQDRSLKDIEETLKQLETAGEFSFYPAQARIISRASAQPSCLLALDVGTGKTLAAIAILSARHAERSLIVVPRGVIHQWLNEIRRFNPSAHVRELHDCDPVNLPKGIYLAHPHEMFLNQNNLWDSFGPVFDAIVLDEAHLICNLSSRITGKILQTSANTRVALTATPIPNRLNNLFPILGWLFRPDWQKPNSQDSSFPFQPTDGETFEKLTVPRERGKDGSDRPSTYLFESAFLARLLNRRVFRLTKTDCHGNMPSLVFRDITAGVPAKDDRYQVWADLPSSSKFPARNRPAILQTLTSNNKDKIKAIAELIDELLKAGEKVLLVSSRTGQLDQIAERLNRLKQTYSRIDRRTPASKYGEHAEKFQHGDVQIMLMGLQCAQSYSFDSCSHVILGSIDFSFARYWQAIGRVWRITSRKPVTVHCMIQPGTSEEYAYRVVKQKQQLSEQFLAGFEDDGFSYATKQTHDTKHIRV